jgi:tight adherence protein C
MAGVLVRILLKLLPSGWIQETNKKLIWSGNKMSLPGFLLIWVMIAALLTVLTVAVANTFGAGTITLIIAGIAGVIVGGLLPQFWLSSLVRQRQYETRKSLPDALDLMTTSVEAGLSLDAAMIRVSEFQRAPFQDELARAMQDVTLGKARRDALAEIPERLNVPEVFSFVQAVNQAAVTGAPIGQVLRVQAEQVRIRRRQAAEAQAQRAPVLMIFPLVFFIFPSIFIVLMAPAILTVIDLLTNSGVFE